MNRSDFSGGGAFITWNGLTLQLSDDWECVPEVDTKERKTNLRGTVGHGLNHIIFKLSAKPIATSANLTTLIAKLLPYRSAQRGRLLSEILGGVDLPCVIQTMDGRSVTFKAALLTKEPDLMFAPNEDFLGEFELTCLLANAGDSATIADYFTEASSVYTEPVLDPLTIISERYTLGWGATSPFTDIETDESGIKLTSSLSLKDCITQRDGLLNYRLSDKTSQVQFVPVNLDSGDFASLIPAVGRGKMIGTFGQALTVQQVTGVGGPKLVCPLAVPTEDPLRFGEESRHGQVNMLLEQKFATTLQEPYTLTVKA